MAPATNLGAATPIQMSPAGEKKEGEEKPKQPSSTLENKMVNDASAFIRGLAERHGRNAEWAERAVREAESLTASEALSKKVIDVIADDSASLADKLEGRVVTMGKDVKKTLSTKGAEIVRIEPGLRHDLLEIITHPNVALLLMSLGTYGLIYEFANPGALFPGIIGAICLLLGLYAMNILPVNYSALALIMLGIGLMTAEAFATAFGLLGISGAIAFIIGAVMLVESDMPGFGVDWWMIALMTTTSLAFLSLLLGLIVKSHRKPAKTGIEEILNTEGEIISWSGRTGDVRMTGEVWKAISLDDHILKRGDAVRVKSIEGLILTIEPKR
jgi:membrane-bound serine protease (ClpP class)